MRPSLVVCSVACIALACSPAPDVREGPEVPTMSLTEQIPSIDAAAPETVRTATFALG